MCATNAVDAMRQGVDEAAAAAERAREHIISLRKALAEETARLADAAAESARMANQLAQGLSHERSAMETLSRWATEMLSRWAMEMLWPSAAARPSRWAPPSPAGA